MITAGMVTRSPITLICVLGLHDKVSVTEKPQRKEQQWQHKMNWSQQIHCAAVGGGGREFGEKLCQEKREELEKGVFRVGIISYYPALTWLMIIKLISSQVCFAHASNRWMISSLSVYEMFVIIALPCLAEKGNNFGSHLAYQGQPTTIG